MAKLVFTEEETMLADSARGFLDSSAPVSHLRALRDAGKTHDAALWAEMAQMGWAGILVPEEAGGAGMGFAAAGILASEMGKTLAASPFISTAVMAATALRSAGAQAHLEALKAIAGGTRTYAFAVDEGPKHSPEATALTATRVGNGYELNGSKSFVIDGGNAGRLIVLAKTEEGLTLFDIPSDQSGVTRNAQNMIDARDSSQIDFAQVEATGDDILGPLGDAMSVLHPALHAGQAVLAAEMTGLSTAALGMTVGYLKERKQFGVPIGAFQALQHRAAHLWSEIEVTASTVLHAGRLLDEDPESAELAVSLAKARACDTANLAVREGVQMHGGIGMTDAYDMGFYMKRARVSAEWLGDYSYHAERVAAHRGF